MLLLPLICAVCVLALPMINEPGDDNGSQLSTEVKTGSFKWKPFGGCKKENAETTGKKTGILGSLLMTKEEKKVLLRQKEEERLAEKYRKRFQKEKDREYAEALRQIRMARAKR
jgi:hypothetical protein